MRPLAHSYTNRVLGDERVVAKTYQGPGADERLRRECALLTRLRRRLPVPPVHGTEGGTLTMGRVAGVPGQELLAAGYARQVLAACGDLLGRIHQVECGDLPMPGPDGAVLVHGDYGPQNVLLDPRTFEITAVVDWEFAHRGDPVEDLAWCEWIVRTHHPEHGEALAHFFAAYGGPVPPWPVRKAAMLARCASLERLSREREPGGAGVRLWQDRAATTARWDE